MFSQSIGVKAEGLKEYVGNNPVTSAMLKDIFRENEAVIEERFGCLSCNWSDNFILFMDICSYEIEKRMILPATRSAKRTRGVLSRLAERRYNAPPNIILQQIATLKKQRSRIVRMIFVILALMCLVSTFMGLSLEVGFPTQFGHGILYEVL